MMDRRQPEPIAIIGCGCRFPGASSNPSRLWDLLQKPTDVGSEIPMDRFNSKRFYHPDGTHHGTSNVRNAYFIQEDIRRFDAQFFGIPPNEADAMDPQHRVLLETVYEAMESAGLTIEDLQGSNTSVYVGLMCTDYTALQARDFDYCHTYGATGTAASNASSRISYFFDWHGPSMTIDTACSSSLVSVHQAVQALRAGASKVAVAAGTNLLLYPLPFVSESKLNMLSPTGRSRMWDAKADGYARGDGVAAVFLKTLTQAIQDGDHIECIIRETGVNQDGKTKGITMPSAVAQAALIRDTYERAGLDLRKKSDRPQYFEAHGTGTPAGDPQEAEALHTAFFTEGEYSEADTLYVGSVKTVIGHTEGTAGICGIIKACMALKHKTIPPNLLFDDLSTSVRPFYDHLRILQSAIPWPELDDGVPRRASVNSFGFGGTNAHAILESYEPSRLQLSETSKSHNSSGLLSPFTFSASSAKSLHAQISNYLEFLRNTPNVDLRSLAYTLSCRRSALPIKAAFASTSQEGLIEKLACCIDSSTESVFGQRSVNGSSSILAVFTGQGAQWPEMGAQLVASSSLAQHVVLELEDSLSSLPGADRPSWRIADELRKSAATSRIGEAALSQPLCTAIQIIQVRLLQEAGVTFKAVVGHSSGEIAASYAAGFISAHDAIRIAYYRGLHAKIAAGGRMMAAATSLEDGQELCATEDFEGRLCVAASNSSSSITFSGDADAINEAKAVLDEEKKFARLLKVDTAYHSHHMRRCAVPYADSLQACNIKVVTPAEGAPKWFSTVYEGDQMTPADTLQSAYWVQNMVQPVMFSQGVEAACRAESFDFGLEIGPHPALTSPVKQTISELSGTTIPYSGALKRGSDDVEAFSEALGSLWTHLGPSAVSLADFQQNNSKSQTLQVLQGLPGYPWNHDRVFWTEARTAKLFRTQEGSFHELLGLREPDGTDDQWRWKNVLKPKEVPWLSGHKLQGQVVFPGTGYIALAMEASMQIAQGRSVQVIDLLNLSIDKAIAIDASAGTEIVVSMTGISEDEEARTIIADFTSYSAISKDSVKVQVNASGSVRIQLGQADRGILSPRTPSTLSFNDVDIDQFYAAMGELGYGYEGAFRGMATLQRRLGASSGTIARPPHEDAENALLFHPGMLDTCLQGMFAAFSAPGDGRLWSIHAPTGIRRVSLVPSLCGKNMPERVAFDCAVTGLKKNSITGDVDLFVPETNCKILQIDGLGFVPFSAATKSDDRLLFSESVWATDHADGNLVLGDRRASPELKAKALDCERAAFYYFRTLNDTIQDQERAQLNMPWHHEALLENAAHICQQVSENMHPYAKREWTEDTYETICDIMDSYGDDADFNIMRAVGDALPDVVRGNTTILEHMTKDGRLDNYYKNALGFEIANDLSSAMIEQLAFRYPHMNILEIGAGTGGSTRGILNKLGTAFSSYTYTDISSGFFEKAQDKFKAFASRMIFKTLDIEKDPLEQGYTAGAYDVIIAANVLHATKPLDQTLKNVRSLLKPGGYLVLLEIVDNGPSRVGLVMGGLPGWWVGRGDGRRFAPTISLPEWDALLKKTGFSGIDTHTPLKDPLAWPASVFASQAIDDGIKMLRSPLSSQPDDIVVDSLVLLGGESPTTTKLVQEVKSLLSPRCKKIIQVDNLEALCEVEIPLGCAVISLSDIDSPAFKDITQQRFEVLQKVFLAARDVVCATRGYQRDNPYAALTVGLCRSITYELSQLRLQLVDFDSDHEISANLLTELLLRLQLTHSWEKAGSYKNLLWTTEPELLVQGDRVKILRVKPHDAQNDRYNSIKRRIFKDLDLEKSIAHLEWDGIGNHNLLEEHRSYCATAVGYVDIKVECSLLSCLRTPEGRLFLNLGIELETGQKVLAVSLSNASKINVPKAWSIAIDAAKSIDAPYLSIITGYFCSQQIMQIMPSGGTLLVHEPDVFLASLLARQLSEKGTRFLFTTSNASIKKRNWLYLHPRSPKRLIDAVLRNDTSFFLDLSPDFMSKDSLGQRISKSLPEHCERHDVTALLSRDAVLFSESQNERITMLLKKADEFALAIMSGVPEGMPLKLISLKEMLASQQNPGPMTIVDWRGGTTVSTLVEPMEYRINLLRGNRTYWMIGLAGDLGQSLTDWMIAHGAKHIVISSRNPRVPQEWLDVCGQRGATVECIACDVTSYGDLQRARDLITTKHPPIAGVANGALALRDKTFATMDLESFTAVCKPKVDGTLFLHQLFDASELDFFIPFSSIVATMGNVGQSAYSAANTFMKSLVAQRRQRGLSGSVIDISRVLGVGYVERETKAAGKLSEKMVERIMNVTMPMSEYDLHQLFAEAVHASRPGSTENVDIVTGIRTLTSDTTSNVFWAANIKFSHFIRDMGDTAAIAGEDDAANRIPIKTQVADAESPDDVYEIFKSSLLLKIKIALQLAVEEVVLETMPIIDLGVDSLVAVEIRTWFLQETGGIDLPVLKILGGASVADLADDAMGKLPANLLEKFSRTEQDASVQKSDSSDESPSKTPPGHGYGHKL